MVKLSYFGHDAFLLSDGEESLIIDPFLQGNGHTKIKPENINVSHILLTHGHADHIGDSIEIAKKNNATIVAPFELATYCAKFDVNVHPMHIGGRFDFGFFSLKLTIAHHGSAAVEEETGNLIYTGNPCGLVVTMGGKTIYHAGDTGIFLDMELIGRLSPLDVALLPIGGNFTMDAQDALEAAKMLKPKCAIPMHYGTFPVIETDPQTFVSLCQDAGIEAKVVGFDQTVEL